MVYIFIYIPPDVVLGRPVFFAVDNVDFAKDIVVKKRKLLTWKTTGKTVIGWLQRIRSSS